MAEQRQWEREVLPWLLIQIRLRSEKTEKAVTEKTGAPERNGTPDIQICVIANVNSIFEEHLTKEEKVCSG